MFAIGLGYGSFDIEAGLLPSARNQTAEPGACQRIGRWVKSHKVALIAGSLSLIGGVVSTALGYSNLVNAAMGTEIKANLIDFNPLQVSVNFISNSSLWTKGAIQVISGALGMAFSAGLLLAQACV